MVRAIHDHVLSDCRRVTDDDDRRNPPGVAGPLPSVVGGEEPRSLRLSHGRVASAGWGSRPVALFEVLSGIVQRGCSQMVQGGASQPSGISCLLILNVWRLVGFSCVCERIPNSVAASSCWLLGTNMTERIAADLDRSRMIGVSRFAFAGVREGVGADVSVDCADAACSGPGRLAVGTTVGSAASSVGLRASPPDGGGTAVTAPLAVKRGHRLTLCSSRRKWELTGSAVRRVGKGRRWTGDCEHDEGDARSLFDGIGRALVRNGRDRREGEIHAHSADGARSALGKGLHRQPNLSRVAR
jgi:hypothetical protein